MEFHKDKFKEDNLRFHESINKQYLSMFPDKPEGIPRQAWETCDLHLESKQSFQYVDPKGNGAEEITWSEPIEVKKELLEKAHLAWGAISLVSFIFFMILYYWGKTHGL